MANFTFSKEQEDIFNFAEHGLEQSSFQARIQQN